jgi:hypothetical protein
MIQVDAARYMPATNSGKAVFMGIKGMTASTVQMTGSTTATVPTIHNLMVDVDIRDEALSGQFAYKVTFSDNTPDADYVVERAPVTYDAQGNPTIGAYLPHASGTYTSDDKNTLEIEDNGVRFSVSGPVSDGDTLEILPGRAVRTDVFAYINEAIDLLEDTNLQSDGGSINLALGLEALLGNMATGLDQVLTARGSTGTRLKELDALKMGGMDKDLQYTESISDLEDLDYYKAISDLYQQQLTLQAAQQTFMMTNGMSLFNMM